MRRLVILLLVGLGGPALFGKKRSSAGSDNRPAQANQPTGLPAGCVSVCDYGAKGDGVTDDSVAIQAAIDTGQPVYLPKPDVYYKLTRELLFTTAGQKFYGPGPGYGLSASSGSIVPVYQPYCGLKWYGKGERYLLTRRQPKNSPTDPDDAPLSVCINIQAEGVKLEGFSVLLDDDFNAKAPGISGAEWDVGIFNGCRVGLKTVDVHIIGYHRVANYYHDVTRAAALPELSTPDGIQFPRGTVLSGADGTKHVRPIWAGGRYAEVILGAIDGEDGMYYNEETGQLVRDGRGGFGTSDYTVQDGHLAGGIHHSNIRWTDPVSPLDPAAEGFSSGAQYIDARAGIRASRVTKLSFDRVRFESKEPFLCRLDRVGLIRYISPQWEWRNRRVVPRAGGDPVNPSDTREHGYGAVSATERTGTVGILFPATNLPSDEFFWDVEGEIGFSEKYLIGSDQGWSRLGRLHPEFASSVHIDSVDLDSLIESGFYQINNPVNGPSGSSAVHLIVTSDKIVRGSLQIAVIRGGSKWSSDQMYFRKRVSNVWRNWLRIQTSMHGQTADRPILSSADIGAQYFDTDQQKLVIWNGRAWISVS